MSDANNTSFSTVATSSSSVAASSPASLRRSSSNPPPFKPTSLIPNAPTLAAMQVNFRNNVMHLAQFYEEHQHYTVPKSEKKLFQFCKNMKTAIRKRREGTVDTDRRLTESQYKILRDIRFVDFISFLDKNKKQPPLTKAYRNILANIGSFQEQNGHRNIMHPGAKLIKTVKHSDGTTRDTDIIKSLRDALKILKEGKLGKDRKQTLKKKGVDLDSVVIGDISDPREENNLEREEDSDEIQEFSREESEEGGEGHFIMDDSRDDVMPTMVDSAVQVQKHQGSPTNRGRRETLQHPPVTDEVRDSESEEEPVKIVRHEEDGLEFYEIGKATASSVEKQTEQGEEMEQQVAFVNEGNSLEDKVESTASRKPNKPKARKAKEKKRPAEVVPLVLRRSNRKKA